MSILLWIILSTLSISLIAWIGLIALVVKERILKSLILPLVAFSAGTLLAGAILHLIPEVVERSSGEFKYFLFIILGFSSFFVLEQFIHWHHCHKAPSEHKRPVTYMILVSDSIHNFIDGLAIGGAFMVDIRLGLVTWFAVAAHEIPQELGDFGVLVHGGWKKLKALQFNFISGLAVIAGGVAAYFIAFELSLTYLLAFAAGSFIYIASSDLIPEVKHSDKIKDNLVHFFSFASGVLLIWAVKFFE